MSGDDVRFDPDWMRRHPDQIKVRHKRTEHGRDCQNCGQRIDPGNLLAIASRRLTEVTFPTPGSGLAAKISHYYQRYAILCTECGDALTAALPGIRERAEELREDGSPLDVVEMMERP